MAFGPDLKQEQSSDAMEKIFRTVDPLWDPKEGPRAGVTDINK